MKLEGKLSRPGGSVEELMSGQVVKASAESILLWAIDRQTIITALVAREYSDYHSERVPGSFRVEFSCSPFVCLGFLWVLQIGRVYHTSVAGNSCKVNEAEWKRPENRDNKLVADGHRPAAYYKESPRTADEHLPPLKKRRGVPHTEPPAACVDAPKSPSQQSTGLDAYL
ncbi:unnamed protein product [Pleuronectes platessa]|uniref:Uncharacterized protein n=1 Tax=Pleuronectes platessa TaxID=8262 RepID=A0A9N7U5R6_PLEPL|nr:unnamed protein product [Pleuronectes platessa]